MANLQKGQVQVTGIEALEPTDVTQIKTTLELQNVDNTSDADKPISTAQQNALDNKVDEITGKQLSTEDYTTAEKNKLATTEEGAQVNQVDSVNTKTGNVVLNADDLSDATTINKFTTQADIDRLANTSGTNTGDKDISGIGVNATAIGEIEQEQITQNNAISLNTDKRTYPIGDETKLATIEQGAEVNNFASDGNLIDTFWSGTQADYDAIATKSNETIYFIQDV